MRCETTLAPQELIQLTGMLHWQRAWVCLRDNQGGASLLWHRNFQAAVLCCKISEEAECRVVLQRLEAKEVPGGLSAGLDYYLTSRVIEPGLHAKIHRRCSTRTATILRSCDEALRAAFHNINEDEATELSNQNVSPPV